MKSNFLLLSLLIGAILVITRLVFQLSSKEAELNTVKSELVKQRANGKKHHRVDPHVPLREVYNGYEHQAN